MGHEPAAPGWRVAALRGVSRVDGRDEALVALGGGQYLRVALPDGGTESLRHGVGGKVWVDVDAGTLRLDGPGPAWRQGLPVDHGALVVPPQRFSVHVDDDACARKLNGFDASGRRCYVQHDHTAVVEGFDIEEFPLATAVRHERRTAWRLWSGPWLVSVDRIERLDSCRPRVVNETFVTAAEAQLGL